MSLAEIVREKCRRSRDGLEVKLKSPAKRIGRWVDWVRGRRESLRKEDLALGQMGQYELYGLPM
jgi:hypothetical protein